MSPRPSLHLPWAAVWTLLGFLVGAMGQIMPSNDSSLDNDGAYHLVWSTTTTSNSGTGSTQNYITAPIEPLTLPAGLGQGPAFLQQLNFTGPLVFITPQDVSGLTEGDIAYLSCENSTFGSGDMNTFSFFKTVVGQTPAAIVLYSVDADHCNFTTTGPPDSQPIVYTMAGANYSMRLENALKSTVSTNGEAMISNSSAMPFTVNANGTANGNASSNVLGPSPTTAVAMIILYSITGVITGLFLIIIITGASRAKGIARAMLETIPIVKFGDQEEVKPHSDVELASARGERGVGEETTNKERGNGAPNGGLTGQASSEEGVTAAPAPADQTNDDDALRGIEPAQERHDHDEDESRKKDEGLGCSICTEDFVKGEDVRVLPCNHKYHPECIDPWLLNVSGTCPLCRIDLRPDSNMDNATTAVGHNPVINADPANTEDSTATAAVPDTAEGRHQRNRIVSFFDHLGINHHSRPEERIAALRRLRYENRTSDEGESNPGRRARLSGVIRGSFRRRSRVGAPGEHSEDFMPGVPEVPEVNSTGPHAT
ncbi:MAG: hypothetical protein M1838_001074 [Thelocarpon superellum]|nr:MAG: hypothetical protein M1838_001074 [Thelocarpon superellum]